MAEETVIERTPIQRAEFKPYRIGRREVDRAMLPGDAVRNFADKVEAITQGTQTVMEILMWNESLAETQEDSDNPEDEVPPPLRPNETWKLARMVIACMADLSEDADRLMEWAYKHHTPEGAGTSLRRAA